MVSTVLAVQGREGLAVAERVPGDFFAENTGDFIKCGYHGYMLVLNDQSPGSLKTENAKHQLKIEAESNISHSSCENPPLSCQFRELLGGRQERTLNFDHPIVLEMGSKTNIFETANKVIGH